MPRQRRRRRGAAPKMGADRLSALPDELLHEILSLLPAHESPATCVLARRWLHLWRSIPGIIITGAKVLDNPVWYVELVRYLLFSGRNIGARLDSFEIDLRHDDLEPAFLPEYEEYVNVWFSQAVAYEARTVALRTTSGVYEDKGDAEPMVITNNPLFSHRLTSLDLVKVYLQGRTLDFSGCPTLVDLKMERCYIAGDIFSPSLKRLSIVFCFFVTEPVRARIRLSRLVSLELIDIMCRAPLLERMPLLDSAIVRLRPGNDYCPISYWGDCGVPDCYGCYDSASGAHDGRGQSLLLNGLSEAAELEVSVDSQVFIVNRDFKLRPPTFSKLKTLLLSKWCPGVAANPIMLGYFLQHSPVLVKLTLQLSKVPKVPLQTQTSYNSSVQSFECSQLKKVEIKCDQTDERIHKVLSILATYGIPPEKVDIQAD